jgi:hypothetical protein
MRMTEEQLRLALACVEVLREMGRDRAPFLLGTCRKTVERWDLAPAQYAGPIVAHIAVFLAYEAEEMDRRPVALAIAAVQQRAEAERELRPEAKLLADIAAAGRVNEIIAGEVLADGQVDADDLGSLEEAERLIQRRLSSVRLAIRRARGEC